MLLTASLSQHDIAVLVGASRPRVREHLTQLESEYPVIRQGRQLIVRVDQLGIGTAPSIGVGYPLKPAYMQILREEEPLAAISGRRRGVRSQSPELRPRAFDSWWAKVLRVLAKVGPGIVTGAADDDPSGIATYSQAGAQFGFTMLWTLLFSFPFMAGIQEISAWIGRVTGIGIAGNIRRHYSVWVLYPIVVLLLIANVINLGADIGAMGGALKLLVGGPALVVLGRVWDR